MSLGTPPTPASVPVSSVYGLTPINAYTYTINAKTGGVVVAGNIMVIIRPGTYAISGTQNMSNYNFSVIYYSVQGLPSPESNQVPFLAFAYAVNGNVTPAIEF